MTERQSTFSLLDESRKVALFEECCINGKPDIDMFKYLIGYDFRMTSFKKAK